MWGFVQDVCFRWSLCFSHPPGPGLQRGLGRPTSWRPVQHAAALSWLEGDKVVAESLLCSGSWLLLNARWLSW